MNQGALRTDTHCNNSILQKPQLKIEQSEWTENEQTIHATEQKRLNEEIIFKIIAVVLKKRKSKIVIKALFGDESTKTYINLDVACELRFIWGCDAAWSRCFKRQ